VSLTLQSGATLVVRSEAGDVIIQGGPIVRINPEALPSAALRTALQPENALRSVDVPRGVDIEAETALAEEHARFDEGAPQWLSDRIAPGGAWDYERLGAEYAAYTSFHLGVVGAAMGLPEGALLRQAGVIRRAKGNSKPEWGDPGNGVTGGVYPYGADPEHQEMLLRGSAFYERRFG
jgi:type VI secretion system secreted protein VgrG